MKITIRDVAQKAGVSISTVSRVMNGTAKVNAAKRENVERAIDELGFKPNSIARSLTKKNSNTIGLVVPKIVNPFFSQIAESVEKRANDNGYKIILCNTNDNIENERLYLESLIQNQVDAFVVISDTNIAQNVRKPVVFLDRYGIAIDKKHPIIRTNHYEGGKIATEHLIEKGCKKIAYIGKRNMHQNKDERVDGFTETVNAFGVDSVFLWSEYSYTPGLEAIRYLFDNHLDVDGIFAGNDLIAYAIIKEAFNRGIKIPDELQVVGYDDIMFSELITPGLTTIAQPIDKLGKLAVEIIVDILNGVKITKKNILLPAKLVKRDTTK